MVRMGKKSLPKKSMTRSAIKKPAYEHKQFRERAVIITQTPMRITLAGGGTDVNWYSSKRGGAWISASINRYLVVTLTMTEDPNFIGYSYGHEAYQGNSYKEIPNPYIRACLEHTGVMKGVSTCITSEVSGRSGLGGSAALEVGLLNALYCFKGESVSKLLLAKKAFKIESIKLKRDFIGPQDQYIVSLGGINYYELDRKGNVVVEPLPLSLHTISELESNLLYFRTGIYRDAGTALADQKKNISIKQFKALDKIKELGLRAKKYLLEGDVDSFGKTFHEHWMIKKTLSDKISNPQIDAWYDEAMKMGALGGKIMGAGGGGWFVFYVKDNKLAFRKRMKEIGLEERKVRFDFEGSKLLTNF
jgi:D-glycero-alpha-D-manno-heptose-7-phosphate kinase